MKSPVQLMAAAALFIAVTVGVSAQNSQPAKPPINAAVGKVADDSAQAKVGVESVIAAVHDAKVSGDSKKMKAALDMAEQQLKSVRDSADRSSRVAQKLRDHMDKIEAQRQRVKDEQSKLDSLFYPTDEFDFGD